MLATAARPETLSPANGACGWREAALRQFVRPLPTFQRKDVPLAEAAKQVLHGVGEFERLGARN